MQHYDRLTGKPCYQKDDRAMLPIGYMDALKIFGSLWLLPRLLFPKLLWAFVAIDRLLFGWTLSMYRPNLKSVALPFPEK